LWRQALATKAQLPWRIKKNAILPCAKRLYSQIAQTLPQDEEIADYVVSLAIEARR